MNNTWPEKIRKLRALRGWTQQDLAERLGVSLGTVSHWERENQEPIKIFRTAIDDMLAKAEAVAK